MEREENKEELSGLALIEKNKCIKKEANRLRKLFVNLDENKKKLAKNLIENAAFMSITLEDLKKDIIKVTISQQPKIQGKKVMEIIFDYLIKGEKPQNENYIIENQIKIKQNY